MPLPGRVAELHQHADTAGCLSLLSSCSQLDYVSLLQGRLGVVRPQIVCYYSQPKLPYVFHCPATAEMNSILYYYEAMGMAASLFSHQPLSGIVWLYWIQTSLAEPCLDVPAAAWRGTSWRVSPLRIEHTLPHHCIKMKTLVSLRHNLQHELTTPRLKELAFPVFHYWYATY